MSAPMSVSRAMRTSARLALGIALALVTVVTVALVVVATVLHDRHFLGLPTTMDWVELAFSFAGGVGVIFLVASGCLGLRGRAVRGRLVAAAVAALAVVDVLLWLSGRYIAFLLLTLAAVLVAGGVTLERLPERRRGLRNGLIGVGGFVGAVLAGLGLYLVVAYLAEGVTVSEDGPPGDGVPLGAPMDASAVARACGRSGVTADYRHVVWIWFENKSSARVFSGRRDGLYPFTRALARACGRATDYHAFSHHSLANYLAAVTGVSDIHAYSSDIYDDCDPRAGDCRAPAGPNLFTRLGAGPRRWRVYAESMTRRCDDRGSVVANPLFGKLLDYLGLHPSWYAAKHNAAVYLRLARAVCASHDVSLGIPSAGNLVDDVAHQRLPAFSFVVPDLCNDTHEDSCPPNRGDAWLSGWMRYLTGTRLYSSGQLAIFVTWDEGGDLPGAARRGRSMDRCVVSARPDCIVPLIVVTPTTRPGATTAKPLSHLALLRTTEDLLGLPCTAAGDRTASTLVDDPRFGLTVAGRPSC